MKSFKEFSEAKKKKSLIAVDLPDGRTIVGDTAGMNQWGNEYVFNSINGNTLYIPKHMLYPRDASKEDIKKAKKDNVK
jgi:hypothetical protein